MWNVFSFTHLNNCFDYLFTDSVSLNKMQSPQEVFSIKIITNLKNNKKKILNSSYLKVVDTSYLLNDKILLNKNDNIQTAKEKD